MTKSEYMEKIKIALKRNNVSDADDIIEEYEQHFAFKLADGYSEEEIAAKLGKPEDIAAQYNDYSVHVNRGKKIITVIGLGVADFIFGILCILLSAWELVMAGVAVSCATAAVCLIGNMVELCMISLPSMPYYCAVIFGVMLIAFAALTIIGAIYFFGFIRQTVRAFSRFHNNTLAVSQGHAVLPSLRIFPRFSAKTQRIMKKTTLLAATIFAALFIVGFIVSAISAGGFEFWHIWGWF